MGNISYKPLIEDMTWSFSRIKSFDDCPHRFFLRYIKKYPECAKFFASYGSFMHKLLERFYRGELAQKEMVYEFVTKFSSEVKGVRPPQSTVQKYIEEGCNYLKTFTPLPYKMIAVEKEVRFKIDNFNFVGFIDYLGEDDEGNIYLVDNKSRNLKERSGREKPTRNDVLLDAMLTQLYLYSIAVKDELGAFPKALCFNCFRENKLIKEQFDIHKYEEAKRWATGNIKRITETEEFEPNQEFFSCLYICGVSDYCDYDIEAREERRRR